MIAKQKEPWLPEYERLSYVTWQDNDKLTLHHIRNFRYDSNGPPLPAWYDRTFRLGDVQGTDLILSYWGSRHIAHVFLSFGLSDGTWIAISVETRRKLRQPWSVIRGFLRQYPVIYLVADERDVIGVRASVREERVFIYPLSLTPPDAASLLHDYLQRLTRIHDFPEKYHTLWNNCTTNILRHGQSLSPDMRYNWRILLSGHADKYCYNHGLLDTTLAFPDVKKKNRMKPLQPGNLSDTFSRDIRQGRVPIDRE
ncbi:DUF4105 domain-containing protein [Rahnella sp. ChDrAdgB13]|uniref:Lnb N-terminal periplasmic domain-containing protein n=1 Tax=Rahnella sp. ChDrAdgB13 TaxID=1850581 RepID=UPI001AD86D2F|nr:DUF4105 domain-containing protein [Rahnella sp. ChDrAdgB13]